MSFAKNFRYGFTIVELFIVLAVVSALIGLLLPAVQMSRESARRISCANNLHQMGVALQNYESGFNRLPYGDTVDEDVWTISILPFLEEHGIYYEKLSFTYGQSEPYYSKVVKTYVCPSNPDAFYPLPNRTAGGNSIALSSYAGVNGTNYRAFDGLMFWYSGVTLNDIPDGLSNTIVIGERPSPRANHHQVGFWGTHSIRHIGFSLGVEETAPGVPFSVCPIGSRKFRDGDMDSDCSVAHFFSLHPGGAHFAFMDGSVRFLNYSAEKIMPSLATRKGHELIDFTNM